MPNGKKAQILHIGSMFLGPSIILKDILHTPEFQFNLLSISKLTKQFSANVIFTPECCVLQDQAMKRAVILGKENKGLYYMERGEQFLQDKSSRYQVLQASKGLNSVTLHFSDSELWHFRFGHLPFEQFSI